MSKKTADKFAVEFYPNDDKDTVYRRVTFRTWREAAIFGSAILHSRTATTIIFVAIPESE